MCVRVVGLISLNVTFNRWINLVKGNTIQKDLSLILFEYLTTGLPSLLIYCVFYVPERSFVHLTLSCWFIISSGWGRVGGGKPHWRSGMGPETSLRNPFKITRGLLNIKPPMHLFGPFHFTGPKKVSISRAQPPPTCPRNECYPHQKHYPRGSINHRCIIS